jgi:hypothetical protein
MSSSLLQRLRWVFVASLFLWTTGCGDKSGVGKTYTVSGKVSLKGGAPLTAGVVKFVPDASKGNKSSFTPTGPIGADGTYTLTTEGKAGAPLGAYKVLVTTNVPQTGTEKPVQINRKFDDFAQTPLEREVVPTPEEGRYNLEVYP